MIVLTLQYGSSLLTICIIQLQPVLGQKCKKLNFTIDNGEKEKHGYVARPHEPYSILIVVF